MGVKGRVLEFMVRHDIIPAKARWELAVSAVGSLYRDVLGLLDKDDRVRLTRMMEDWGLEHSKEIMSRLDASRDLHGCAVALMAYHRVFGIKSTIIEESDDEITIHVSHCMWKDKRGWTPETCASIEGFETGLVRGINSSIRHSYSKRRSLGDEVCEMHLRHSKE